MKLRGLHGALGLCSAGWVLFFCGAAWAQSQGGEPTKAEPYVDRVLDSGPQTEQPPGPNEPEDSSGWPRGWSTELQATRQTGYISTRNQALLFSGYLDTPNYGALSANITLTRDSNVINAQAVDNLGAGASVVSPYVYQNSSTWRIDQRAMPLNGGWFVNNSAGFINMAGTPMSRGLGRIMLPNASIEGASSSFEQPGRTVVNVSGGSLGFFDGIVSQGFTSRRGNSAGFGGQTLLAGDASPAAVGRTDAAVQYVEARGFSVDGTPTSATDTRSVWSALSWQGAAPWADGIDSGFGNLYERVGGMRVQANVVHSDSTPSDALSLAPRNTANGGWIDASWRGAWLQQSVSLFQLDPGLRWGADTLPGDLRGVSWRGDVSTRQWQLGSYVEFSKSVSGLLEDSTYLNAFGRYRFDSRDAIFSNVAARSGSFAAQSLQINWEHQSQWGYTQWQNQFAHNSTQRILASGVDHAWNLGEFYTLSTSLGLEQLDADGFPTARAINWGVVGTMPFLSGSQVDVNLRGTQGVTGTSRRFFNGNVRVSWPIARGWSFIAQVSASEGREPLDPTVVSALTVATTPLQLVVPSTRGFLIALRYEGRAGSSIAPIGGAPGAGSGRLEGVVFFDQDGNGRREANEAGVPNVTVLLDRRFVARTDAQGRYSFPAVGAGKHEIELVQDNLPLPWSSPSDLVSQRVEIFVRSTATADFPVQRGR